MINMTHQDHIHKGVTMSSEEQRAKDIIQEKKAIQRDKEAIQRDKKSLREAKAHISKAKALYSEVKERTKGLTMSSEEQELAEVRRIGSHGLKGATGQRADRSVVQVGTVVDNRKFLADAVQVQ